MARVRPQRQDAGMPRTRIEHAPDSPLRESCQGLDFEQLWARFVGPEVRAHRRRQVLRCEHDGRVLFAKRFLSIQPKNWLRLRLTEKPRVRSQAAREAAICELLRNGGFHPPRVLLWAEEIGFVRERRSLLLCEAHAGPPLCDEGGVLTDDARLFAIADELGAIEAAGLHLPDLGTDHVFLLPGGALGLLDFTNARSAPRASAREVARALVRFFRSPRSDLMLARGVQHAFAERFCKAASREDALPRWETLARERLV